MSTNILFGNTTAYLHGDERVKALVKDYLTFRPEGFQFTAAYKRKRWDGFKTLYQPTRGAFPAGLTWDIAELLRGAGEEVFLVDERIRPKPHPALEGLELQGKLMPHQTEAVLRVEARSRGVVHHPVGAGKSVVIVEAARRLAVPTLVLVQRKELLTQQYRQFVELLGSPRFVGRIGDGLWEPRLFTVATIQTLSKRFKDLTHLQEVKEFLEQWECVMIDECHHLPAASYSMLLHNLPNAYYRIGLSATPHRSGKKEQELYVTGLTGPIISAYDSTEGIDMGRLVPADVFLTDPGPYVLPKGAGSYADEVAYGIVENERRNELIVKAAMAFGQQGSTLILTERIEHGKNLRRMFLGLDNREVD